MSAAERSAPGGVVLARCEPDIIELGSYVIQAAQARRRVAGVDLPPFGQLAVSGERLVLSVRPGRWLILSERAAPGAAMAVWQRACAGQAAVVELSAGLAALVLAGPRAREVLSRGCRLDLEGEALAVGRAAATIMAQVAVTLAVLPAGWLLLTPASTAQHLYEWLTSGARHFGLAPRPLIGFRDVCGEQAL